MFECLHVHVAVCMHVGLLTSPLFVIEDDTSGHCRLVVVLVDEVEGRNSDVVSLTYRHIDMVCLCVCVCVLQ